MSQAAPKLQFLLDLQEQLGGSIPFERWMQEALYHPEFGYYAAGIRGIGRRGDFTTWPVLHESLARGIARWALANKPSGRWHLIEIGAGTGTLAAGVLRALGWWNRPQMHIVEVSPPLRQEQQTLLGRKTTWHPNMTEALAACDGSALIYSNELVDAFPARIFQNQDKVWHELALRIENGRVEETWLAPLPDTARPDSTAFATPWPEGQRIEVQESFATWRDDWRPAWKAGAILTIDYGDACPALYHRRPQGSLRAFAHHQRLEGAAAYAGFGVRDLTVDVNFSDLIAWGGPPDAELLTLDAFLARQNRKPASGHLDQFPEAGEAFKVLIQSP